MTDVPISMCLYPGTRTEHRPLRSTEKCRLGSAAEDTSHQRVLTSGRGLSGLKLPGVPA